VSLRTSVWVLIKLGAVILPLVTCGAMSVAPKRTMRVPADWAKAAPQWVAIKVVTTTILKLVLMIFSVPLLG